MSTYGQKIIDGADVNWLTAESATIISVGSVTMPNALNDDDTYGYDIDLPGVAAIPISKIGVIIQPSNTNIHYEARGQWWNSISGGNTYYSPGALLRGNGSYNFYTRADATGIMTAYTPGDLTLFDDSKWDGIISLVPSVGWVGTGVSGSSITGVRLLAYTYYAILSGASSVEGVYSIGNTGGITDVNYAIFLKEWDY